MTTYLKMNDSALDPRPFEERPVHWHYGRCGWQQHFIWEERVAMSELGIGPEHVHQNSQKRVSFVSLRSRTVGNQEIAHLAAFEFLNTVDLVGSSASDDCIPHLMGLQNLKWVWIAESKITENGARSLEKFRPGLFVFRKGEGAIKNPDGQWIKINRNWWPSKKPWWMFW